jgi:hypothetical protein
MSKVTFLPRLKQVVSSLRNSSYLDNLQYNKWEQQLKNDAVVKTDICEFYGKKCGYLSPTEQGIVRRAVNDLHRRFPYLPATEIFYVAIHEESLLEFGNTSFTVNNVVFLHPAAIHDVEVIQHETIHVLQRVFPQVFEHLYKHLNYRRASTREIEQVWSIIKTCNTVVIDNPDESLFSGNIYIDPLNRIVCYNKNLEKVIVDMDRKSCHIQNQNIEMLETIWGHQVEKDSMSEMFAVLMTKSKYNEKQLREKVNNLLRSFTK